ncbi:MAG: ABC transporter ATP-binding protein [Ruminiclostridium sp.]|nr:ABC transporter ATP-binding protein [Ruminiclostridium sp.]
MAEKKKVGSFVKLLGMLGKDKGMVAISFLFALFYAVTQAAGPLFLGQAITVVADGVLKMHDTGAAFPFDELLIKLIWCGASYLLNWVFLLAQNRVMIGVTQRMVLRLRTDIADKLQRLPLRYYESKPYGELLSTVTNDINVLSMNFQSFFIQIADAPIYLIIMIVVMFTLNPLLAVVVIASVPLSALGSKLVLARSQKYYNMQQNVLGELNGQIEENFTGFDVLKLFGNEAEAKKKFGETNRRLSAAGEKALFRSYLLNPVITFIGNLSYLVVLVLGGYLAFIGMLAIGDIQTFINYVNSINQPMQQIAKLGSVFQSFSAAADRIFTFLAEEEEYDEPDPVIPDGTVNASFEHISFGYTADRILISDFTFDVSEGQHIAIVGPTGAGKTTLIKLLMRFYDVNGGLITVGGQPITKMLRKDLHELIGIVPQDTWFFEGSIADNLRLGNDTASDDDIMTALKEVGADYFVDLLPGKMDFVLRENASNISAGQRQLLAIARAFIANRPILILDEATSCVDTQTERRLQQAMNRLMEGKTTFVIAHRLSTIVGADCILYLEDGDVKEQGSHEQLMDKHGAYRRLFDSQYT